MGDCGHVDPALRSAPVDPIRATPVAGVCGGPSPGSLPTAVKQIGQDDQPPVTLGKVHPVDASPQTTPDHLEEYHRDGAPGQRRSAGVAGSPDRAPPQPWCRTLKFHRSGSGGVPMFHVKQWGAGQSRSMTQNNGRFEGIPTRLG